MPPFLHFWGLCLWHLWSTFAESLRTLVEVVGHVQVKKNFQYLFSGISWAFVDLRFWIRFATAYSTHACKADFTVRVHWQGTIWRSLARSMAWWKCCCKNIFFTRWSFMEEGNRDIQVTGLLLSTILVQMTLKMAVE